MVKSIHVCWTKFNIEGLPIINYLPLCSTMINKNRIILAYIGRIFIKSSYIYTRCIFTIEFVTTLTPLSPLALHHVWLCSRSFIFLVSTRRNGGTTSNYGRSFQSSHAAISLKILWYIKVIPLLLSCRSQITSQYSLSLHVFLRMKIKCGAWAIT